ncbi:hypothetical protein QWZ06_19545 [Chryseobacterium tructae]|uniref:Uncharacterized protein n=1 Tax=Chryseobacterium tructae TaxID=1037380 RepID=A0ABV7Y3I6_9FLAO|nr:hypothetical protein [Chryseobacterium tructae]MDN3694318.1 hypothetical protein [Chryseobacterium tructae]
MDIHIKEIYNTIYTNAILFLKRGIKEITKNGRAISDPEQAIISCFYIQTSIELSLKTYLIKEIDIYSILESNRNLSPNLLLEKFKQNHLKTKRYDQLKKSLKKNKNLTFFNDIHFKHLDKLQMYRNRLVHLNLLSKDDINNIQKELIFAVTHLLMPLLTDISFKFETPTQFYKEHLDKNDYKSLISFHPYIDEMHNIAVKYSGLAYECLRCYNKTFSPNTEICYCCNLQLFDAAGYIDCDLCSSKKSIIYDTLNIHVEGSENSINGFCMSCGDKMMVYDCPECEGKFSFYGKPDLEEKICNC